MHTDVVALLAVQEDDTIIHELEERLAALAPRLDELTRAHERASAAREQAHAAVVAEERRGREMEQRVAQHRQLMQKNESQLEGVQSEREATAAMAQLDQARRMIQEDDHELQQNARRIEELRAVESERAGEVDRIEREREEARASLGADMRMLEEQLHQAREERGKKATKVPRALLRRYDRIRSGKHLQAIFALRGSSCGNCDTMIPLQRRSQMSAGGGTDLCEGCGVLLYAAD